MIYIGLELATSSFKREKPTEIRQAPMGKDDVKMEAEIGVIWLQANGC